MGWVYWPNCMLYTWRRTPRIARHLASQSGNLPALGDLSRSSPLLFYNIWQAAKISWHAANSTSPDPLWSWMDQYLAAVTKSCWKTLFFVLFWPWPLTYDPDLPKFGMRSSMSSPLPKIMSIGPLAAAGEVISGGHTHTFTDHYYGLNVVYIPRGRKQDWLYMICHCVCLDQLIMYKSQNQ